MGFFSQNATFSGGGDYAVAAPGTYKCALEKVETVQRPSFEDPSIMEGNFRWTFETLEDGDENGRPFRFTYFTKTSYGNDMAKLTKLLDGMLLRRLTQEEFAQLDLDDIKARAWSVSVDCQMTSRGREINTVLGVRPWANKPQPRKIQASRPPVEEDIKDPFDE